MSLVELAAPNTRANRAAGVVLAVRPTLSPMVHNARCLLEYITHPGFQMQVSYDWGRNFPDYDFTLLTVHTVT